MIFSHQDVPSFVGKSCQDVPSLGRKNQWVRSCLSISVLLQCLQLQNGTSYSSVLMIFSHQDVPSFVGKSCQDVPFLVRKNQWVHSCLSISVLLRCSQFQSHTSFSSVLMIFSHQDVPSFVGKSCQDVPSLVRKNQWVHSCLSISVLLRCFQFQSHTSFGCVLMIFSHQDVPSFFGKSCQDVPSLGRKNQ